LTPVKVNKQAWQTKIKTVYEEPEDILDTRGELDWLFKENSKAIIGTKKQTPTTQGPNNLQPQRPHRQKKSKPPMARLPQKTPRIDQSNYRKVL
jgi:hypothetical protein